MEETTPKPIWASKTFWANIVGGVVLIASAAGLDIGLTEETQTELIGGVMVLVNVVLRFITTRPVTAAPYLK